MKKTKKIFKGTFLLFGLTLLLLNKQEVSAAVNDESEVLESYFVEIETEEQQQGISAYALDTNTITVQSNERVSYFDSSDYGEGHKPRITTSIKYIVQDGTNGDSRGPDGNYRKRYVYCLAHEKDAPIGQTLQQSGWSNTAVYYVIYHGAVYYGETCRNTGYSTGNWQWDYLATHFAIVVVTGQYTLEDVTVSIQRGNASTTDKQKLITAISNMVKDAVGEKGTIGFDSGGWFCINEKNDAKFELKRSSDSFSYKDGKYYSDWITPYFTTRNNYYANEQIVAFSHADMPKEIIVETKYPDCIHSPYRLVVNQETYRQWQRTGKKFTIHANILVPGYWKMAQFAPKVDPDKYQNVALPIYDVQKKNEQFSADISFSIPRAYVDLKIKKVYETENSTNQEEQILSGAEFSVYTDKECKNKIAVDVTDANGIILFKDLNWNQTYYIKETNAPDGYRLPEPNPVYEINTKTDESELTYTVHNQTGKKLPETGSHRMICIMTAGMFCMIPMIIKKTRRI